MRALSRMAVPLFGSRRADGAEPSPTVSIRSAQKKALWPADQRAERVAVPVSNQVLLHVGQREADGDHTKPVRAPPGAVQHQGPPADCYEAWTRLLGMAPHGEFTARWADPDPVTAFLVRRQAGSTRWPGGTCYGARCACAAGPPRCLEPRQRG